MTRKICLWFLIIFSCSGVQSQTKLIERLHSGIVNAKSMEEKLQATLAFCDAWESYSPDTLRKYVALAQQLATERKDQRSILLAGYYQAAWLFQVNQLDSALASINRIIGQYTRSYPYDEIYLKMYGLRGNVLTRTARMEELMSHNLELLKLAEKNSDSLGMARATLGVGNAKSRLKEYDEALSWYHRALNIMRRPEHKRKLSFIYNNIAIAFYFLDKQDSAEYYIQLGVKYSREDENLTNLANALFVYGGLMAEYGRLPAAEAAFKEAVEVRKQIGDVYYIINDMSQLALFYANNGNPGRGIELCKEGLALAEKNGSSFPNLSGLYEVLGRNYREAGDYKSYSETLNKLIRLKDSAYKINSPERMAELEMRYEVQKKENTIIQQKLDLVQKNYFVYGAILLSVIIAVSALLLFRNFRKQQKMKTIHLLEKERKRIAADLHDNLGAFAASIASNLEHIAISEPDPRTATALNELRVNSQSIVSQLSDTIWVLKKDALTLTDISDRIKVFVQQMQRSYPGVQIEVAENIERDIDLPPIQAFHLFRIVQEAINNALRHSGGNEVLVQINSNNGWRVSVRDNGKGLGLTRESYGNGLNNMMERSKEAGWHISWKQNETKGTTVIIEKNTATTIN
jgi:signal transduction histidine kinase